ncbi:MAG: chorismate mutase [Micrococcus sp.]|nr:chorismate mutase [Micrococcus sp.]
MSHEQRAQDHRSTDTAAQAYDARATSLSGSTPPEVLEELYAIRGSIDNIDASLVYLLAERFKFTQRVGRLKAEHALPPSDPGRESAQIARLRQLAVQADLEPEFATKFLNFVIAEVIRHHQAMAETVDEDTADSSSSA